MDRIRFTRQTQEPLGFGLTLAKMIEIEILLTAIFIALCVIAIRLGKTNEHLSDCKRELSSAVPHLHAMRKDYEPPEPEPPPLTLDEAPQMEIRAKEQPTI